jgi:hypothetical protein
VDHVLPRRPPPITEPMKDVDAVGVLYPSHSGDMRQWDTFAAAEQGTLREWAMARAAEQRAKEERAAWEARVKLMLAETPSVVGLPPDMGLRRIDWNQNKAGSMTNWEAVAKALGPNVSRQAYEEIVREHTTTKDGARPLRVYEIKGSDE